MARGRFIVMEGVEGAGKSNGMDAISDLLLSIDKVVYRTREPGGTPLAEGIRELFLHYDKDAAEPMTELLLVFAARAQHLQRVILPRLAAGEWVVCDRFTDSSYAYQGAGRKLGDALVAQLETAVQGTLRPDLVFVMDLPVSEGMERNRLDEHHIDDRIERERKDFHERVRASFLQRAAADTARYAVIDAGKSKPQVRQEIRNVLRKFISQWDED